MFPALADVIDDVKVVEGVDVDAALVVVEVTVATLVAVVAEVTVAVLVAVVAEVTMLVTILVPPFRVNAKAPAAAAMMTTITTITATIVLIPTCERIIMVSRILRRLYLNRMPRNMALKK